MPILITGAAGFIGSAVTLQLLAEGKTVVGIDNLNHYYDVQLKKDRLAQYSSHPKFSFKRMDIVDRKAVSDLFLQYQFDVVIHLAAQAGVRYSLQNPAVYIDSNLVGFANILESSYQASIKHFVYASSSSVYGANLKLPFSEQDSVDHPLSLYAATKRANELLAHSYAHSSLPCTGLRFFTVYGPWGRPDMALFSFTRNILEDKPIPVFNQGNMMRDFTYVDDIVAGIVKVIDQVPQKADVLSASHPAISHSAPYRIYNIGNHQPVKLKQYIAVLEKCLNKKARLEMMPMQAGDVPNTYADVSALENLIGALPHTPIETGIAKFVKWYQHYYNVVFA
ncbi:MAG: hypothetical protein ACD_60C00027G0013 [uncultured bacterium]|nr:MAG: hypothetical protein ACD_60C00027G0013 [uncultured bacterium]